MADLRALKDRVAVGGVGNTKYGSFPETDDHGLGAQAFRSALEDSGLDKRRIDGLLVCRVPYYARMGEILGISPRWTIPCPGTAACRPWASSRPWWRSRRGWPPASRSSTPSAWRGSASARAARAGAPCYGEDNEYVYGERLGMSSREIAGLAEEGVI